jgi:NAD(P)H-binding
MKILVTGGSSLSGKAVVPRLRERGHDVRELSRHANAGFHGDVADAASIHGAASHCDAILHMAEIVEEQLPDRTFTSVNIGGTRNLLAEATRAGVQRFVYVSSLGAERGTSDYDTSKREAETLVQRSGLDWTIVRPVAGEDLGEALARIVERGDLVHRTLELGGGENRFAEPQPENIGDGVGRLEHKRFVARIDGSRMSATELMTWFRTHIGETMPVDVDDRAAEPGAVLTIALPLRGDVQVRVEAAEPNRLVLGTVAGHPLAGIVEFSTRDNVEFAIDIWARAANVLDYLAIHTAGAPAQKANWMEVLQRVIDASGGTSQGIVSSEAKLSGEEEREAEARMQAIVGT